MPGRALAVTNGAQLVTAVAELGEALGLEEHRQLKVARRLWGAERRIDVVLVDPRTRKTVGIECKYQSSKGTAEEKIPAIIEDIKAWPIDGLVVFAGTGFTRNMESYLISTGKAIGVGDLEMWLRLYFGLSLDTLVSHMDGDVLVVSA